MIKRSRQYLRENSSLSNNVSIFQLPKPCRQESVSVLFQPPYREIFQLSYLYSSPLSNRYENFIFLLKVLQNFNQQTRDIENNGKIPTANQYKIACMRFIYKQMLFIGTMDEAKAIQRDEGGKLKDWYLKLTEKHSFLQGINFNHRKAYHYNIEESIRRSYISNVYDEIDDYIRKQFDETCNIKFKNQSQHRQKDSQNINQQQSINLPLIDIRRYKRQQMLLSSFREKSADNRALHQMKMNVATVKQNSLSQIKSHELRYTFMKQPKKKTTAHIQSYHNPIADIDRDSHRNSQYSMIHDATNRKRPSQMRCIIDKTLTKQISLVNVNGINLIRTKNT